MDRKRKRPGGAEKQRTKKLKSLKVEAAKCAKLTDLFGAVAVRRETSEGSDSAAGAGGDLVRDR